MALSSACYGITPIVCFQRVEFAFLAIEQFINNAAKNNYLAGGLRPNPCLFRLVIGRGWGQGPSHSQSYESIFAQIPNIDVYVPSLPQDSKYIFSTFRQQKSPTISIEHRWCHYAEQKDINRDLGSGCYVYKEGTDLTITASSINLQLAAKASKFLADFNIHVEIINVFRISNIDMATIFKSIRKTKKLLSIDIDQSKYSMSSEIISACSIAGIHLEKRPRKLSNKGLYSPSSRYQIADYYLSAHDVVIEILSILEVKELYRERLVNQSLSCGLGQVLDVPDDSFKGPF